MELVYLWVEEYKNIKRQGFNFSPRFKCKYDEEKNELNIDENKNYISVFPENINITAIVGENGSGKSTILEYFNKLDEYLPHFDEHYNDTCEKVENFIYVFNDENGCQFISNIKSIQSNKTLLKQVKHTYLINYKQNKNNQKEENLNTLISIDKSHILLLLLAIYTEYKFYPSHYIKKIDYNFELTTFLFLPNRIVIIPKNIKEVYKNTINKLLMTVGNKVIEIKQYEEDIFNNASDDYHLFLIIWYINKVNFDKDILISKKLLIEKYNLYDAFEIYEKISEEEFRVYYSNKTIVLNKMLEEQKARYFKFHSDYFEYDFVDNINRKYNNLSHGEQNIYGQFLNMFFHLILEYNVEEVRKQLFFNLDEPDISLHPNWQKSYIKELINTSSKFNKKIHFIITSHSPFIISDLPKENIIFLDKYKEEDKEVKEAKQKVGNCKNVSNSIEIEQTFGANIHTLLSHGFFMKDGLMGEFAKEKITEVFEYLKNDEPLKTIKKEDIEYVIGLIGEEFLREKLLNMYRAKFNIKSKDEEIADLKAEIERLKNGSSSI